MLVLFKYFGQLGNDIFIVCSSWFLLSSNKTKLNKALKIIMDSFIISVLFLGAFIVAGYPLSASEIVKNIIPITMNNNWFVGCYIIFYAIHPLLNYAIKNLSRQQLLKWNIIFLISYCGINLIISDRYYYTQVVGFIVIYFFTAYMKNYMKGFYSSGRQNCKLLVFGICGLLAMILLTDILGLKIAVFSSYLTAWSTIINPFIIMIAIALFNIANKFNFYVKSINYLSSLSLFIYMIHANRIIMDYLKMEIFGWICNNLSYRYILLWVLIIGLILLISSTLISAVYKQTLGKITGYLSNKTGKVTYKLFSFIDNKFKKFV